MTYNRDLQEDKERLFDSSDTIRGSVRLMAAMLPNISVDRTSCERAGTDSTLLATDLADYLVRKGMPFREAHHIVGAVVAFAEKVKKPLRQLTLQELQAIDARFGKDALQVFDLKSAMAQRDLIGAPGTVQVGRQLACLAREKLAGD